MRWHCKIAQVGLQIHAARYLKYPLLSQLISYSRRPMDFPSDEWLLCQGIRSCGHKMAASVASIEEICPKMSALQATNWDLDDLDDEEREEALDDVACRVATVSFELQSVLELLHSGIAASRNLQPVVNLKGASHGSGELVEGERGSTGTFPLQVRGATTRPRQ